MVGEIACPVCNSYHTKSVFNLDALTAGSLVIPDNPGQSLLISHEIESLWQSNQGEFHRCSNCMFGFAWPFLAGNEKIYSALYYKDFSYPKEKWEYDRAVEIILKLDLPADSTLLELGAGNGSFLEKASTFVGKDHIYSTEYSSAGKEELQRKGFRCYNKSVLELPDEHLPGFDIICMFQVLEHMDELDAVFQALNSLGKRNSHLIIAVPNGVLRNFCDKLGIHLDVPPIHVGRFSQETFQYLGKKHGWKLTGTWIEPQKYSFKVKKFVFDRFARKPFAQRMEQSNYKLAKYFFRYLIMLLLLVRFLPLWFYLMRAGTGTSMLVHLQKQHKQK